jgi:hypothetical protein
VPPGVPAPIAPAGVFTPAVGDRNFLFDSFYLDDRGTIVAKASHPRKSFYNRFNRFVPPPPSGEGIQVGTGEMRAPNPLNSTTGATVLPQKFEDLGTKEASVRTHFDEQRIYRIFVPPKVLDAAAKATDAKRANTKVSLFYDVDPEINLFGLCSFFEPADDAVLITIPGVELWQGYGQVPWGIGITTAMIRSLFDSVKLEKVDFKVSVMAGYSTGYRGVNLTVINKMVDLSALQRLVYFDAFYHHDDHPVAPAGSKYVRRNTRWAVDTAIAASAAAQVLIYGVTTGGTPRQSGGSQPRAQLKEMVADHGGKITFVDLEFPRDKRPAIMDELEKVCLARLIQGGIDDYFQAAALPADVLDLAMALPARGSLGTFGRTGFTDLYAWVKSKPAATLLSGFSLDHARALVAKHDLMASWTAKPSPTSTQLNWYEMRHREFVQEVGKEAILP